MSTVAEIGRRGRTAAVQRHLPLPRELLRNPFPFLHLTDAFRRWRHTPRTNLDNHFQTCRMVTPDGTTRRAVCGSIGFNNTYT